MMRLSLLLSILLLISLPLNSKNYDDKSLLNLAQTKLKTKSAFACEFNFFKYDRKENQYNVLDIESFTSINGRSVVSGQHFFFRLRPYQRSYCYIFNIDSRNKLQILFPRSNIYQKNPLDANKTYYFPPFANEAGGDLYQFDYHSGLEKIYIILSPRPINSLENYTTKESSINERSEELTGLIKSLTQLKKEGSRYIKADLKKRIRLKNLNGLTFHPTLQVYKKMFIEKLVLVHLKAKDREIDLNDRQKLKKEIWYKKNSLTQ